MFANYENLSDHKEVQLVRNIESKSECEGRAITLVCFEYIPKHLTFTFTSEEAEYGFQFTGCGIPIVKHETFFKQNKGRVVVWYLLVMLTETFISYCTWVFSILERNDKILTFPFFLQFVKCDLKWKLRLWTAAVDKARTSNVKEKKTFNVFKKVGNIQLSSRSFGHKHKNYIIAGLMVS